MRKFSIVITGECPDDITDDQLAQVANAAEVQVIEPQVDNPDDSYNPLEFKTEHVQTHVALDSFVRTFLDLSTAHLPQVALNQLEDTDAATVYSHPQYGCFVHVYGEAGDKNDELPDWYPDELKVVVLYARTLGVDYVLFDRDGEVDPHLPTWEW